MGWHGYIQSSRFLHCFQIVMFNLGRIIKIQRNNHKFIRKSGTGKEFFSRMHLISNFLLRSFWIIIDCRQKTRAWSIQLYFVTKTISMIPDFEKCQLEGSLCSRISRNSIIYHSRYSSFSKDEVKNSHGNDNKKSAHENRYDDRKSGFVILWLPHAS